MRSDEYKAAMKQLGYGYGRVQDWCELLGISESTHKKYSGGFMRINGPVERLIHALFRIQELENNKKTEHL